MIQVKFEFGSYLMVFDRVVYMPLELKKIEYFSGIDNRLLNLMHLKFWLPAQAFVVLRHIKFVNFLTCFRLIQTAEMIAILHE